MLRIASPLGLVVLDQLLPQVVADRLAEALRRAGRRRTERRAQRAGLLPVAGVPPREDALEFAQHFFELSVPAV